MGGGKLLNTRENLGCNKPCSAVVQNQQNLLRFSIPMSLCHMRPPAAKTAHSLPAGHTLTILGAIPIWTFCCKPLFAQQQVFIRRAEIAMEMPMLPKN